MVETEKCNECGDRYPEGSAHTCSVRPVAVRDVRPATAADRLAIARAALEAKEVPEISDAEIDADTEKALTLLYRRREYMRNYMPGWRKRQAEKRAKAK